MSKFPFMQFFTGDWLKDPAVSLCAPATRGVWIDLLCAMHEAGRVGSLCGTAEQLARLARCVPADLALALTDIQTTGAADVTERNGVITVVNRRMKRESQDRDANRVRQSRWRSSQPPDNDGVTPKSPSVSEDDSSKVSFFSGELPPILDSEKFRARLSQWLAYKAERGDRYKPAGLTAIVSRAANLAEKHGVDAVMEAMERAAGNQWAGWDQPGCFNSKGQGNAKRSGQTYDPAAGSSDPNYGTMR